MPAPRRVAIQGVRAAFHDVAARAFFGEIETIECASFARLGEALRSGEADRAVMAIENSIAGSILTNYGVLETHGFKILGEVYLRIEMNLMALPGTRLEDVVAVQSHPMALLQCQEYLLRHPWMKATESSDTAESAKLIAERQLAGHAAIASRLAAETYGLEVLAEGIETNERNYTRFLAIARGEDVETPAGANKASIRFEVHNRPGSLVRVLNAFSRRDVNMNKIQSVPILGQPYQYSIHVDLEWENRAGYHEAMGEVATEVVRLIHFGEYVRSERPSL